MATVEKNYRVYTGADHRAIGGLSMGAMQSVSIGLAHPELFHYVLAYSGGFGSLGVAAGSADVESQTPWKELLADPAQAKKSLRLLGCGQDEAGLFAPGRKLTNLLQEKNLHMEWRDYPGDMSSVFGATTSMRVRHYYSGSERDYEEIDSVRISGRHDVCAVHVARRRGEG